MSTHQNHVNAYTLPLEEPSDLDIIGGKAVNLGRLISAGAQVPPGFVVTTHAYRESLSAIDTDDTLDISSLTQVRERIRSVDLSPELKHALVNAYYKLGAGNVAVRSSATTEDLTDAAFAGQHDTFLGITNEEDLIRAVKNCWASLWSERAVAYRQRASSDSSNVAIAVVIQEMVPADSAGVMFTCDPVTGDTSRISIDAEFGLGESVVSGLTTPDHYVVDTKKRRIVQATCGKHEVVVRLSSQHGTTQTDERHRTGLVLTRALVKRLASTGKTIAKTFGAPQDIEWAIRGDVIYILQTRAITATGKTVNRLGPLYRRPIEIIAELTSTRPLPLDVTTWTQACFEGLRIMTKTLGITLPRFQELAIESNGVLVSIELPRLPISPWSPVTLARNIISSQRYSREALESDPLLCSFLDDLHACRQRSLSELSVNELNEQLMQALGLMPRVMQLRARYIARSALALGRFAFSLFLLHRFRLFGRLLAEVEHKTSETNRALESLADQIRSSTELTALFANADADEIVEQLQRRNDMRSFADSFTRFLTKYGHREVSILSVSQPTWRDDPSLVVKLLISMCVTGDRVESDHHSARSELFEHRLLRLPALRRSIERQLEEASLVTQFREDTHFYSTMPMPEVRRILIEFARRLVANDVLNKIDDVFYLRYAELRSFCENPLPTGEKGSVKALVEKRKELYAKLADRPVIDPRYFAPLSSEGALLVGTAGAAGIASGPVRIIASPSGFHELRTGDVLVAPTTNPMWTPLFARCCAIVTDTGGSASHAAIVAREYGIPAVLGTGNATSALSNGTVVTVDGQRGVVSESANDSP